MTCRIVRGKAVTVQPISKERARMAMIPPRRCFSWKAWQPKGPAFSPYGYPVPRTFSAVWHRTPMIGSDLRVIVHGRVSLNDWTQDQAWEQPLHERSRKRFRRRLVLNVGVGQTNQTIGVSNYPGAQWLFRIQFITLPSWVRCWSTRICFTVDKIQSPHTV